MSNIEAISKLRTASEQEQIAAVMRWGFAIKYITRPSEAVQLAAVTKEGYAIKHIKNPSEAVQIAAVNQNPYVVTTLENPSEAVLIAAVKNDPRSLDSFKDKTTPSKKVILTAILRAMKIIIQFDDPHWNLSSFVRFLEQTYEIYYKKFPDWSEWSIIKPKVMDLIGTPLTEAIVDNWNPPEAFQLAAVKRTGNAIKYIENPSEAVQLAAVKQNGRAIEYIKTPSKNVILTAILKMIKDMILIDTQDDLIIDDQNRTLAEVYWKYSQQFPNWPEWKVIEPKVIDLIGNISNYIDVKGTK